MNKLNKVIRQLGWQENQFGVGGQLRAVVRWIDTFLRKSQGIYEFTDDPECILRIQLKRATHDVAIDGERILKGDNVLAVHAWNERIPKIPTEGADLKWALRIRQQLIFSFRALVKMMRNDSRYAQARAVCGESVLFSFTNHTGGTRLMQHLGFTILRYHRPLGRFGEFWENLFSWWLLWTFIDVSLHSREFWRLQRTEIWMTVDEFNHRYGKPG